MTFSIDIEGLAGRAKSFLLVMAILLNCTACRRDERRYYIIEDRSSLMRKWRVSALDAAPIQPQSALILDSPLQIFSSFPVSPERRLYISSKGAREIPVEGFPDWELVRIVEIPGALRLEFLNAKLGTNEIRPLVGVFTGDRGFEIALHPVRLGETFEEQAALDTRANTGIQSYADSILLKWDVDTSQGLPVFEWKKTNLTFTVTNSSSTAPIILIASMSAVASMKAGNTPSSTLSKGVSDYLAARGIESQIMDESISFWPIKSLALHPGRDETRKVIIFSSRKASEDIDPTVFRCRYENIAAKDFAVRICGGLVARGQRAEAARAPHELPGLSGASVLMLDIPADAPHSPEMAEILGSVIADSIR